MGGRNGYFQLDIRQDGTYIKLFEAETGGQPILYDDIMKYFMDIRLYEFDKIALGRALTTLIDQSEVKLTPTVLSEQDEYIRIELSDDKMKAQAKLYPPSKNGKLLTKEDIVSSLVRAGVKYGVDEVFISQIMLNKQYCTTYILAKATPPVEGHDALITYYFNTDFTLKPKTNEDGSVDFHQLDMISHCKKGDLLATLTPVDQGKPGIDICGKIIRPLKVNNKVLRYGNNIQISDDALNIFSLVDGHVTLTDGRVFVSDSYEIPADVDASTGDIEYEGNVVIKGNVITGFSVKAKGDIEVNGVVEGAYIEAGGHIILKRGMQGMNKGILKAAGNVITKFLENAEVIAGGYVTTESILHSKVSAKGDVIVGGRRGFVTGGEIRSGSMISVKTAGSHMGTNTLLEVGIDPKVVEEFREIEKKLAILQNDKEKIAYAIALFRKKLNNNADLPFDKLESLKQLTQNNILIETQVKELTRRYEELKIEMESNLSGVIKVSDTIYPGTKLVISNVTYYIREEHHHSKFVRDRADIRILPL